MNYGSVWKVLSSNKTDYYTVKLGQKGLSCNCLGFQYRWKCRHVKLIQPLIDEQATLLPKKLSKIKSGITLVTEIDEYLTEEEYEKATGIGLITAHNGRVHVL